MTVRDATQQDLQEIVAVHQKSFAGYFMTLLGPAFLKRYYRAVLEYPEGLLLVSIERDRISGFVAGLLNPALFYRALRA
jgi:hypothetical protein